MFTVTEKALEVIKDFIKEKKADSAVRITIVYRLIRTRFGHGSGRACKYR